MATSRMKLLWKHVHAGGSVGDGAFSLCQTSRMPSGQSVGGWAVFGFPCFTPDCSGRVLRRAAWGTHGTAKAN